MYLKSARAIEWLPQAFRFAVAGGIVTGFSTFLYLSFVAFAGSAPYAANFLSYVFAMMLGYCLHSRWTFQHAPASSNRGGRRARFVVASLSALALNSLWVWIGELWKLPPSAAAAPMIAITPVASFAINRFWVFEQRRALIDG